MHQSISHMSWISWLSSIGLLFAMAGCASKMSDTQLAVEAVRSTLLAGTVGVARRALVVIDTNSLRKVGLVDSSGKKLLTDAIAPLAMLGIPSVAATCTEFRPNNCMVFAISRYEKTPEGVIVAGGWAPYHIDRSCPGKGVSLRLRRAGKILVLAQLLAVERADCPFRP